MDKHMYVMSKRNNDDIATARNKTICNLIALALIYLHGGAFITLHLQYWKCKDMNAPPCTK